MKTYIALLRGINVSGQKKIKMADLRAYLEELDFQNIRTYIQSGNIVFDSVSTSTRLLENQIKAKIKQKYGFEVPTMVKVPADFKNAIAYNPYQSDKNKDPKRVYLTFLAERTTERPGSSAGQHRLQP